MYQINPTAADRWGARDLLAMETLGWGTVAVGVDVATTLANSLTFGYADLDTESILQSIDADAANVFMENRDTIQTISLIGGSLVPAGLALKGLGMARAGVKGINAFDRMSSSVQLKQAVEFYSKGREATDAFKKAKNMLYAKNVGKALTEAAVTEAAVLATMYKHPYMEDYEEDLAQNLGLALLLGGGLGSIANVWAARRQLRLGQAEVRDAPLAETLHEVGTAVPPGLTPGAEAATLGGTLQRLAAVKTAKGDTLAPIIKEGIESAETALKLRKEKALGKLLTGSSEVAPKSHLLSEYHNNPLMQQNVHQILDDPSVKVLQSVRFWDAVDSPTKLAPLTKVGSLAKDSPLEKAVYSPRLKSFIHPADAAGVSSVADMGKTWAGYQKAATKLGPKGAAPRPYAVIDQANMSAAQIEDDLLSRMAYYETLDNERLSKLSVHGDDLNSITALLHVVKKQNLGDFKVKLIGGEGKDELVSAAELTARLTRAKSEHMSDMLEKGVPREVIEAKLNLTPETAIKGVGAIGVEDFRIPIGGNPTELLGAEHRLLEVRAAAHGNVIPEMQTAWTRDTLARADRDIKDTVVKASNSSVVADLNQLLESQYSEALAALRAGAWADFAPSKVASRFLSSADFSLREVGEMGMVAASIGKGVERTINKSLEKALTPLRTLEAVIRKDEAAMIELNTAVQLYKRLQGKGKGKIRFENGTFYTSRNVTQVVDGKATQVTVWDEAMWHPGGRPEAAIPFKVKTPAVAEWLETVGTTTAHTIRSLKDTNKAIKGQGKMTDQGFWLPVNSPVGKEVAYIEYPGPIPEIRQIIGEDAAHLEEQILALRSKVEADGGRIIQRGDEQELWSRYNQMDYETMLTAPDASKRAKGTAAMELVSSDGRVFSEVTNTVMAELNLHGREHVDLMLSDIFDQIDMLSAAEFASTGGTAAEKALKGVNPAQTVRNIFLGRSNLKDSRTWKTVNSTIEHTAEVALKAIAQVAQPILAMRTSTEDVALHYAKLSEEMRRRGIINVYEKMFTNATDEVKAYAASKHTRIKDVPQRIVHLQNALAATTLLRVLEHAQAMVNMLSLPITIALASTHKMPAHLGGQKLLSPGSGVNAVTVMFDGVRMIGTDDAAKKAVMARLREQGTFQPIVSEATNAMAFARAAESSMLSKIESAMNNKFVDLLSWGPDKAEQLSREAAAHAGYALVRRLYGNNIPESAAVTFVRNFVDQVIGNYSAPQRPTAFQGILGVSVGLFQTYMLTIGQNIARKLELKDWKGLAQGTAAQAGVFGVGSLPGFEAISKHIGAEYSEDHVDLETGIHRAAPGWLGDALLYGLPSSFGPALHTRGDLAPRTALHPGEGPAGWMVSKDILMNTVKILEAAVGKDENKSQSLMEAVSAYSINRPIARIAELFTGYSVTRAGNTAAVYDVMDGVGTFSRLLGTRSLAEAKFRQATHLNTFYNQLDRDNRQNAVKKLRSAIRAGNLTENIVADVAEEYLRSGTMQGFRSALNDAVTFAPLSGEHKLATDIPVDSPLFYMLDNLD